MASFPESAPILLYDGYCALCNGWVSFLLKVDRAGALRFAPLTGVTAQGIKEVHPELEGIDSLVFVEGPTATVRSTAVLRIVRYLGGLWRIGLVGYLVPREIRDSLYDIVAFWRTKAFGRYDICPVPPAAVRTRFLP